MRAKVFAEHWVKQPSNELLEATEAALEYRADNPPRWSPNSGSALCIMVQRMRDARFDPVLIRLCKSDPDWDTRENAIMAVSPEHQSEANDVLALGLNDPDIHMQRHTAFFWPHKATRRAESFMSNGRWIRRHPQASESGHLKCSPFPRRS